MIEPMLAKDASGRDASNCYWERKFDGARVIAFVDGKNIKLQARSGSNKTDVFPELRIETKSMAILDGEVVSESGTFSSLQRRVNRVYDIELASQLIPVRYEVFDILQVGDTDLTSESLVTRKQILQEVLVPTSNVQTASYTEFGFKLWEQAVAEGWEGIIGKKKDEYYEFGKRRWLKLKLSQEDEFMVVGYTKGEGRRGSSFGALVLTSKEGGYVGQVGTGFDDTLLVELMKDMKLGESPFRNDPVEATWVRPFLVKVRFLEYTNDGILRSPSLKEVL